MERFKAVVLGQLETLRPAILSKKPHFNFITIHYFWIVGFSLLGSILIYSSGKSGTGNIAYIDALLFGTGANTQAGLNPVDVNLLNTFQQIVIFFCAMMSNPITINSFVVFLRLYWFEKRFQHVVREARLRRGTLSKSKSAANVNNEDQVERGVNGRHITLMSDGGRSRITNDGILLDKAGEPIANNGYANTNGKARQPGLGPTPESGDLDEDIDPMAQPVENRRPEVKFADTVTKSDGLGEDAVKLPASRPDEDHIAFLERQRNIDDDEVLHIPGPRDADAGMRPSRVTRESDLRRALSMDSARQVSPQRQVDAGARPQAITIEEPEKPRRSGDDDAVAQHLAEDASAAAHTLSALRFRKPRMLSKKDQRLHHDEDALHPVQTNRSRRRQTFDNIRTALSRDKDELAPYLSWEPTLGRNSAFPGLSEEQREELGGIEYRSLKTLALVLICYFWGYWFFAVTCLAPWINNTPAYGSVVENAGQDKTWWGFFTANSAFMDLGFTITPDSMNSFNTAIFPLLIMGFLIVIGNTGFPVMLRFMIWLVSLVLPRNSGLYEEIRFLLDHPRRCFTLLFPSGATWWLFWLLVILNGLDLLFFVILDLGPGVVSNMPVGIRILDGIFQALSTRTAGFSCVNLAELHPAVQTSYMIMMYISVFPIAISVRRTNVYEEKSLGIYHKGEEDTEQAGTDMSYVGAHLRRQLSFDLWFLFIGFFILSISEGPRIMAKENPISMFAILFEIVSAYGTVGLSLGFPDTNTSLCAQFSVVGKLVVIAMMIRGRHRGLPYGLDRAILLPSESLNAKEAADADARMARRASVVSNVTHHSMAARGRTRSISADRSGNGLLASFLHPGPAVNHDPPLFTSNSFAPRRSHTDSGFDNFEEARFPARRVDTVTTVHTTMGH